MKQKKTLVTTTAILTSTLFLSNVGNASAAPLENQSVKKLVTSAENSTVLKIKTLTFGKIAVITGTFPKEGIVAQRVKLPADGQITIDLPKNKNEDPMYIVSNDINLMELDDLDDDAAWDLYENMKIYEIADEKKTLNLKKGTYIIYTGTDDETGTKNYTVNISYKKVSNVEFESNDTKKTANYLKLGTTYKASMSLMDEADYYKVVVPAKGELVTKTTASSMKKAFTQKILNEKGTNVKGKTVSAGKVTTTEKAVTKGTYYFKVEPKDIFFDTENYKVKAYVRSIKPTIKSVSVHNTAGTANDYVTVKGVKKGSIVKIYNDKKTKVIATKKATSTTVKLKTKQLKNKGTVYVSVQHPNLVESKKLKFSYK